MTTLYCVGCGKKHNHWHWINTAYEVEEDGHIVIKHGWFCGNRRKSSTPDSEFVPDRIKNERMLYKNDILQPYRDGKPSREFIDIYPDKAKSMFTEQERRRAKRVWTDTPGWRTSETKYTK